MRVLKILPLVAAACLPALSRAGWTDDITAFPAASPFFSVTELSHRNYIFCGWEDDRFCARGNFGFAFPLAALKDGGGTVYSAGIAASDQLVMFPQNTRFLVDNFYSSIALYMQADVSGRLAFRLYPVHHVSAHLVDGHRDLAAFEQVEAVSSEMCKIECMYLPADNLTLSAGCGGYYHTCGAQKMRTRCDVAMRLQSRAGWRARPYLQVTAEALYEPGWRFSGDIETGFEFVGDGGRGVGLAIRYFDRVNPGYFYRERDQSLGVQVNLML